MSDHEATREELDAGLDEQHGWTRIGGVDSAARRSLWMRLRNTGEPLGLEGVPVYLDGPETVTRIELRSGREGQDNYAVIERDNPAFEDLLAVLLDARFAVQS